MADGKIVQCIGAVVDVEFPRNAMPRIFDALKMEGSDLTLEVQQQLGDGVVRTIALGTSDGLRRGMIIQNTGADGTTDFTFTVHKNEMNKALSILRDKVQGHIGAREISGDDKIAKVSIVGVGMRSHVGIASKMFRILAEEGINIQMISTSEIKIAVVVDEKYLELAVRVLHKAFELDAE